MFSSTMLSVQVTVTGKPDPILSDHEQLNNYTKLQTQTRESISLDEDFDMSCRGIRLYGPIWDHVLGYWKASQEMADKILFMKYEDMKGHYEFLGFPFTVEEERPGVIQEVTKLCSFDNLKDLE
ncbi:hypothetical protein TEA_000801 [Camellia sinensis var. sinensis]|uniref:Sulfotransferase n=1 Tax=Camellia sinensis var. sinensis TaxID=542762 RepID=A0A4S4DT29_CAMSN|nr:hypothetical protein TEA_000801 [Camellia sinensis var. sinensis]